MGRVGLSSVVIVILVAACDASNQGAGESTPGGEATKRPAVAENMDSVEADGIADSRWRLVSLGGEPLDMPGGAGTAPLMALMPDGDVSGFGGCNRYNGTYELEGGTLRFGRIASTKMACPQVGDVERRWFSAISDTAAYRVDGGTLVLLDEAGAELARLEATKASGAKP